MKRNSQGKKKKGSIYPHSTNLIKL